MAEAAAERIGLISLAIPASATPCRARWRRR